jgi:uncharacterized membrane protein YedE/YeeE
MTYILNPWPWYVSGPLIAVIMALLLYYGKTFGMSSNLKTMCTLVGADKVSDFFNDSVTNLNPTTSAELKNMGFNNIGTHLVPSELFNYNAATSPKGLALLIIGGLLVGFGTRYADGCTSGHAISGLSSLQKPSLIAVIGFFIGGLIMTNFILPLIF